MSVAGGSQISIIMVTTLVLWAALGSACMYQERPGTRPQMATAVTIPRGFQGHFLNVHPCLPHSHPEIRHYYVHFPNRASERDGLLIFMYLANTDTSKLTKYAPVSSAFFQEESTRLLTLGLEPCSSESWESSWAREAPYEPATMLHHKPFRGFIS